MNVDIWLNALADPHLHRIVAGSSPVFPDGMPLVWASGFLGFPLAERVTGVDLVRSLRMHRRLVMGFAFAGLLLAVIYMVSNWSVYTAQSLVYIEPTPSAVMEAAPMHRPYNYDPAMYDSYIQQQMLSMTRSDVLAGAVHKLAPGVWQQSGESDQNSADRLHGAVEVARVGTSYQVAIPAHATNPDTAAALLTSINSRGGLSSAALNAEADQLIATDPGLSSLKQAMLTRRAGLVSHMSGKTPDNPQYKQDQEELQKIDASLESETQDLSAKAAARIEEQLRTDLDRTASLEARLNGELAQMTRAAASATPKLQRSSDLANDITRLQNRYNTVDEQLQNQTMEDSAPGAAHLAEAAVPPTHPALAGVIRNALLLLFAFISLGLAAAVVARKLDPRVYVAADVEQLLGYAPMAQLPDFDEFSDEVAEEHLLRLATGIEFACKDGQLTTCVFTGTGPGVGVTTIVTRVKEMLGLLGRKAVLVDAAGPVPAEQPSGMNDGPAKVGTEFERNTRGSALMPHIDEGTPSARECLMLTDTAPLTVSAEAEYLARRADCTILVIESGVTTRAQLRAAASSLQRLNAAAVGFVLNRVSLKNADESFRHSVSEMERHLRVQGRTAARTVAQSPRIVPEAAHPSPEREIPVLAQTAAAAAVIAAPAAPPARQAAPGWAAPERAAIAPKPLPEPAPEPLTPVIDEPIPQPVSWAEVAPRAQKPQEETPHWLTEEPPWWMTKAPTHVHPAMELPRAPRVEALYAADAHGGQTPATAEVREEEKAADEVPTRLSALRGLLFSLGVTELSQKKDAGRDGNGNGAPGDAAPVDPEQTIVAEALAPWPEPEPAEAKVEAKAEETSARKGTPRRVTAEPEFLPPPVEETNKGKESGWNRGNDDTGARDDIQILPSRRGQYRG